MVQRLSKPDLPEATQIHPLMIDHVLEEIFAYLRAKELLSCRLVCKHWNNLTIPNLLEKGRITLTGSREFRYGFPLKIRFPYLEHAPPPPGQNISDIAHFLKCMENRANLEIPSVNYCFDIFTTSPTVHEDFSRFLSLCGPSMKNIVRLELEKSAGIDLSDFRTLFEGATNLESVSLFGMPMDLFVMELEILSTVKFLLTSLDRLDITLPALKVIRLPYLGVPDSIKFEDGESTYILNPFWTSLFRAAIHLEEVDATLTQPEFCSAEITGLSVAGRLATITDLTFGCLDAMACATLSSEPDMKLKTFKVHQFSTGVTTDALLPFFESQTNSLKTLVFGYHEDPEVYSMSQFPVMSALEELTLILRGKEVEDGHCLYIQSLVFSRDFPSLKCLKIDGIIHSISIHKIYVWDEVFSNPEMVRYPCLSLKKLVFDWNPPSPNLRAINLYSTNGHLIDQLLLIFPNMTALKIWPSDRQTLVSFWSKVNEKLPNITALELGFDPSEEFNDDTYKLFRESWEIPGNSKKLYSELTDYDKLKRAVWKTKDIYLGEIPDDQDSLEESKPLYPSVCSLKNLQLLRFCYNGFGGNPPPRFTDVSGYSIFANLGPSVQRLEFGTRTKMSEECWEYIRMKQPDLKITF